MNDLLLNQDKSSEMAHPPAEPFQVTLTAGRDQDNRFHITAACQQELTAPWLELPGAVVGELESTQDELGWEWRWQVRLPHGVSGAYTATLCAPEITPQTVSFEYRYAPPRPRGAPREQYKRCVFVYHPTLDYERFAILAAFCYRHKYPLTPAADDAGVGDLDDRGAVVVLPGSWDDWPDPERDEFQHGLNTRWYELHYPGVQYYSVEGETAEELEAALQELDI